MQRLRHVYADVVQQVSAMRPVVGHLGAQVVADGYDRATTGRQCYGGLITSFRRLPSVLGVQACRSPDRPHRPSSKPQHQPATRGRLDEHD